MLQLIYVSFTREDQSLVKINIKKFFDCNGVEILIESLAGLHFQNIPRDYLKEDENIIKTYNFSEVITFVNQINNNTHHIFFYNNVVLLNR